MVHLDEELSRDIIKRENYDLTELRKYHLKKSEVF